MHRLPGRGVDVSPVDCPKRREGQRQAGRGRQQTSAGLGQKDVTYVKDIKPMFDKSCINCHGPDKQKGKLRLDSLPAALKGGQDGKVIEPGDSAKSVLVHNVAHLGDEDDYMPPPDNKDKIPPLTKEQIGLIRAWIDQGAK